MDKFKRSLSFRKKRDSTSESSKPHQWQEDEKKVREGTCSFQVRYLGCIEVFESRGIQVCEEAIKGLKMQNKGKYQRAILYVSGDALRVVDEISKGLIVDQTIEKVSFCAPDRNNDKGFAYICRDGTTRRWMCHGFLALKESGERLSHAVGCAFTVCLEKKQAREKEKVTVTFNENGTSFTRTGSFRQTTLTERLADPQSAIIADPVPVKITENLFEIQRPRPSADMLQRQSSFRAFTKLAETSPFKRQMSLRLEELSSTTDRLKQFTEEDGLQNPSSQSAHAAISPIMGASPMTEPNDSITQLCQQVTHGLSALTSDDPFLITPAVARLGAGTSSNVSNSVIGSSQTNNGTPHHSGVVDASSSGGSRQPNALPASAAAEPIRQSNPWDSSSANPSKVSDADFWLHSTANIIGSSTKIQSTAASAGSQPYIANGIMPQSNPSDGFAPQSQQPFTAAGDQYVTILQRAPHLAHLRAHSVDSAYSNQHATSHQSSFQTFYNAVKRSNPVSGVWNSPPQGATVTAAGSQSTYNPFDAAWAAKIAGRSTNPFHSLDSSSQSFKIKM